jgi:hypothetical protein
MDDEGFFYRSSDEAVAHADPAAVWAEINEQIKRALAAGVDATHTPPTIRRNCARLHPIGERVWRISNYSPAKNYVNLFGTLGFTLLAIALCETWCAARIISALALKSGIAVKSNYDETNHYRHDR